jgi:hypothetical protein
MYASAIPCGKLKVGGTMEVELETKKSMRRIQEIDEEFTDVPGAARFLHVSEASVRRHLTDKTLTRYKACGRTLLKVSELRGLVKAAN